MHVCVDKLAVKVLGFDAVDESSGDFIVQSVEDRFDSCVDESLVACITSLDQVICTLTLDWFCKDGVGVAITEHEDTAVSLSALPWKHARQVSVASSKIKNCESSEIISFAMLSVSSAWVTPTF